MVRQLTGVGRFSCVLSCALLAACGGRAHSNDANPGDGGAAPSVAGRGSVGGAGLASGGDGASHAGTASDTQAGSASGVSGAQGGTADAGSGARSGSASGGNAHAGAASAGSNATGGAAGAGGTAAGGAAGALTSVAAACSKMCDELSECPDGGGGFSPPCTSDCSTAISIDNAKCTAAGVDMLSCLTSALHDKSVVCTQRFRQATQTCDTSITSYRECVAYTSNPPPPAGPLLCVKLSIANTDGGIPNCMDDLLCLDHRINNLRCIQASDGRSNCACFTKFSRTDTTVNDPTLLVCKNRWAECMATGKVEP